MVARRNPFDYGGPVSGDHFAGPTREVAVVVSRLTDHVGVVVTAPRRYGKSSLVKQACYEELTRTGYAYPLLPQHYGRRGRARSLLVGGRPDKRPGHRLTAVAARRERLALAQSDLGLGVTAAPVDTGGVTLQSCGWHLDHLFSLAQRAPRGGLPAACGTVDTEALIASG